MPITVWAERFNALPGWNAGPSQGCHHVFVHLDDIKGEHQKRRNFSKRSIQFKEISLLPHFPKL